MKDEKSVNEIIDALKQAVIEFKNDFSDKIRYDFHQTESEDEVCLHFKCYYEDEVNFDIVFKKLKTISNHIPNVKGYNKLEIADNPYKSTIYSDENNMLGHIYEALRDKKIDEIACYEKLGIILLNPLKMQGLYNINVIA